MVIIFSFLFRRSISRISRSYLSRRSSQLELNCACSYLSRSLNCSWNCIWWRKMFPLSSIVIDLPFTERRNNIDWRWLLFFSPKSIAGLHLFDGPMELSFLLFDINWRARLLTNFTFEFDTLKYTDSTQEWNAILRQWIVKFRFVSLLVFIESMAVDRLKRRIHQWPFFCSSFCSSFSISLILALFFVSSATPRQHTGRELSLPRLWLVSGSFFPFL